MKIALLSRPDKAVTPKTTSSRPRVVSDLAEGLTRLGHEVTTFASGDSEVPGRLISPCPIAIEKMPPVENAEYRKYSYMVTMIEQAIEHSSEFDIIHNHIYPEFIPLLATSRFQAPLVTTIHTQILPYMNEAFSHYRDSSFVALSDRQRQIGSEVNYIGTVYNGIAVEQFDFNDQPEDYLLFFGRMKGYKDENGQEIDPKGVTQAIKVAQLTGEKLYIAGNVEDPAFYEEKIKPHLSDKIKFIGPVSAVGPITFEQKVELYKNAKALLNPISWEEPFGLVMTEAMACGTPVISYDKGAVREIVTDGVTGYIVQGLEEMAAKIAMVPQLNRHSCRQRVEEKFTVADMAKGYEQIYRTITGV